MINKDSDKHGAAFYPRPGHAQGSCSTSEDCYRRNASSYKKLRCEYLKKHRFCVVHREPLVLYPLRSCHMSAESQAPKLVSEIRKEKCQ